MSLKRAHDNIQLFIWFNQFSVTHKTRRRLKRSNNKSAKIDSGVSDLRPDYFFGYSRWRLHQTGEMVYISIMQACFTNNSAMVAAFRVTRTFLFRIVYVELNTIEFRVEFVYALRLLKLSVIKYLLPSKYVGYGKQYNRWWNKETIKQSQNTY